MKLKMIRAIAVLLGRLRMNSTDAIKVYNKVCSEVLGQSRTFGHLPGKPRFDASKLEECMSSAICQYAKRYSGSERFSNFFLHTCQT